jgi:hypothetical protein
MGGADEDEVEDRGLTAVGPVDEVVGVAVAGRCAAAGDDAAAVAGDEGAADGGGDEAVFAADVEGFGVGAEDDRDDAGVAGESARRAGRQPVAEAEVAE